MPEEIELPHVLPPWSREKRIKVAIKMTAVVFAAALILGMSLIFFTPLAPPTLSKMQILKTLLADGDFLRATKKAAMTKICTNDQLKFSVDYQLPISPTQITGDKACLTWLLTNPNGGMTQIEVNFVNKSRSKLVAEISQNYESVSTKLINNNKGEVSMILDTKSHQKQYWILALNSQNSLQLTTTNPDSTLDNKILVLIEGFRPI